MELRKLQRVIVDALEDVKAQDIRVFDTSGLSDLFDRVVIATGSSNRQTRSLALSVQADVEANGGEVISSEGLETGEWVLVDCGDVIVHILQLISLRFICGFDAAERFLKYRRLLLNADPLCWP